MKKTILGLILMLCMLMSLGLPAFADSIDGGSVTFDGKTLSSNYSSATFSGAAGSLQPGDEAEITISLINKHEKKTDWWLKNEILDNFLASEQGGAYTYKLSFTPAGGSENIVYESKRVGGIDDNGNSLGLKEVNSALKDYLYLGELGAGKTGVLKLYILLDGETQGNAYNGQLAKLQLKFAVEQTAEKVVRTGDETNTMPLLTAAAVSGVVLLALAFVSLGKDKKQKGEAK